jgi:hypothetical protein
MDPLRYLLAGVTKVIEKLERGSLIHRELCERSSNPLTIVAYRAGLMRRRDEVSHRFLACLVAARSLEHLSADVAGDAQDPGRDFRATTETRRAAPFVPPSSRGMLTFRSGCPSEDTPRHLGLRLSALIGKASRLLFGIAEGIVLGFAHCDSMN